MPETLADSLRLVLPHLPAELAAPQGLRRIQAVAAALPPVTLGGFETRLGPNDQQVDLLQLFSAEDGLPALLAAHIEATGLGREPAWARVRAFCLRWAEPGSLLSRAVKDIWLEFDLHADPAGCAPTPSVFITINQKSVTAREALAAVEAALAVLLGGPVSAPLLEQVARCFSLCPTDAAVSHVALMLSRTTEAVRLNVQRLRREPMLTYLAALGWPGPLGELDALLKRLFELAEHVTPCIDLGPEIYPRLGLECNSKSMDERPSAMKPLLDDLVLQGMCTPEKRAALPAWAGVDAPNTMAAAWPDHLIIQSLLDAPGRFGVLGRTLSHVKIVYQPGRPLEAKAYIGFGQLWLQPGAANGAAIPAGQAPAAGLAETEALEAASLAAVRFLLAARSENGWWQDFRLPAGASDEWVTAFVAGVLADWGGPAATEAARQALALLETRRVASQGWGYSGVTPADADSTLWVLQLARRLDAPESQRHPAALQFLNRHRRPGGGLATYADPAPIRRYMAPWHTTSFEGWFQAHPCVTAAGAAGGFWAEDTARYLLGAQAADGRWPAYWWCDDEYATALAAEALAGLDHEEAAPAVQRAVRWAEHRLGETGCVHSAAHGGPSAFATAWCLRALLPVAPPDLAREPIHRAAGWLLAAQNSDGSWPASARLRVPMPDALNPEARRDGTLVVLDGAAIFTTATVLAALLALRRAAVAV